MIEFCRNAGGRALWFADMSECYGSLAKVVSVDLNAPAKADHNRIIFLTGDVTELSALRRESGMLDLLRPCLLIEDSAHTDETCFAVLEQSSTLLLAGDLLVMEDGVLDEFGLSSMFQGGPTVRYVSGSRLIPAYSRWIGCRAIRSVGTRPMHLILGCANFNYKFESAIG